MGTDTVESSRGEDVTEASVAVPEELWIMSGAVLPGEDSVECAMLGTSDVVGIVLVTVELEGKVVSPGDEIPWDTVSAAVEPLGEGERDDVVTSVSVV